MNDEISPNTAEKAWVLQYETSMLITLPWLPWLHWCKIKSYIYQTMGIADI